MIACIIILSESAFSQADISMATHWFNRANYNPASIARTDYIYLFSNVRSQWTDIDGAPKVFNVQVSDYIHSLRSAFGLSMVSDQIGLTQTINPMFTYAFRISNETDWSLSMGISGGIFSRSVNGSLFSAVTVIDPLLLYNIETISRPDANLGVEFQNQNYIIGLSTTHLFSLGKPDNLFLNTNHRYGYFIYKNNNLDLFNYNVGLQVVNRNNLTVMEVNGIIHLKHQTGLSGISNEMIDLGLTYRTSKQMTALFGINLTPFLKVGYAYDQSFMPGYSLNSTNEIVLEYRIPSKASSICIQCREEQNYWSH
jgi:type IX secretion system PorP/SprF family membrane protein